MIAILLAAQAVLQQPAATPAAVSYAAQSAADASAAARSAQAQADAAMARAQDAASQAAAAAANAITGAVRTVNGAAPTNGNVTIAVPLAPDLSPYALRSQVPPAVDLSPYALRSQIPTLPDLTPYALKAQVPTVPDLSGYATTAAVTAQIAAAVSPLARASDLGVAQATAASAASAAAAAQVTASAACKAAPVIPPVELVGGAAGTSAAGCRPSDAVQPRITRAAIVLTDANGGWSVAWKSSLPAVPVTLPIPVNATAEPVVCNVATTTMAGASGRCWYARTLPSTIAVLTTLVNYDLFGASAANISVQVMAIPTTQ